MGARDYRTFASYTEISPSGTGAKIFFRYWTDDLPLLREAMGGLRHSREFKRGNGKDHPPAIELHLSNQYFTVTEQKLEGAADQILTVKTELLLWLLREAGPAFADAIMSIGSNADGRVRCTGRDRQRHRAAGAEAVAGPQSCEGNDG
jgi:hypothetical protein